MRRCPTTIRTLRCLCFIIAVTLLSNESTVRADIEIYPAPSGLKPAMDFAVTIDGRETFVYDSPVGAIVTFGTSQPVRVEITPRDLEVKHVDVRPKRRGVVAEIRDRDIVLQVSPSSNLSVEFNGDLSRPLFLFVNDLEQKPDLTSPRLRYFAGGRVYQVGEVELHDDDEVYVAGGAVVRGSFKATGARHVTIRGPGIIDGTGVRGEEEYRQAVKNYRHWRKLIHLEDTREARVADVVLVNSNAWNIVPERCMDVAIENVRIVCGNPSDDGIDILQSEHVRVRSCFIRTKDDAIAIKALFDSSPERRTRDVIVEDCTLWSAEWGNSMEIGFETLTPVIEDVVFRNCTAIHKEAGAIFSIHNSDHATVRNIRYENIVVEDARHKLIDFAIFVSLFSRDNPFDPEEFRTKHYLKGVWSNVLKVPASEVTRYSATRGQIENIVLSNIQVEGPFPFSVINGFDEDHRVRGVSIRDLVVNGRKIESADEAKLFTRLAEQIEVK